MSFENETRLTPSAADVANGIRAASAMTGAMMQVAAGVMALGIAGAVATVAGAGKVMAMAGGGALTLQEGVLDAWRRAHPQCRLAPAPVNPSMSYLRFALPVVAQTETVVGQVLEAKGLVVGRNGELTLADGKTRIPLIYAVFSGGGQLLLGIRRNEHGILEAITGGDEGYRLLNEVLRDSLKELALATLGNRDFRVVQSTAEKDGAFAVVLERKQGRATDRVILEYVAKTGQLAIKTRGSLADGKPALRGNCADIKPLLDCFKQGLVIGRGDWDPVKQRWQVITEEEPEKPRVVQPAEVKNQVKRGGQA